MKTLVLGASGQLGQALQAVLEREGIETLPTFHKSERPSGRRLDVREAKEMRACFDSFKPDVVFMAINASGGVDACEEAPDLADAVIVQGTKNILSAAKKHKTKIVFYSSDYVFNGENGPYSEEDEPSPVNAYGEAKLKAEGLVSAYPHGHLIIRTTAVYSWLRGSKNFAMRVFERLGAGKRVKAPKDQLCNPTLAGQLAETSLRLVLAEAEGVYNVVGSTRTDRSELAKAIAKTLALDSSLIQPVATSKLGQKAARPLNAGLKTDKLEKLLGTKPLDLGQSLKRLGRAWRSDTHIKISKKTAAGSRASKLKQDILKKVREFHEVGHAKQRFIPGKSRVQYAGRVFGAEELVNLVDASLDFWLTLGPYGDLFEGKMRRHLGCRDFVYVSSGSTANLTAVMALMSKTIGNPLKPGDEVITPAVTFPTTVAPLVHAGLIPVFVDCEIGTYNIDPKLVDAAVSKRTRAIMIPHTLGNPCGLDVICEVAKRRGLYLIEDACDALGSTFDGRKVGTFGDLGTASFFPAHHITTGEGGGVIVNRARLVRTVRSVRDWGRDCWCAPGETNSCGKRFGWQLGGLPRGYDHKYAYSNIGYNFKPTDLQAAIGAAQADRLDEFNKKRRQNFQRLAEGLASYADRLILPKYDERADPAWFALPLTVRGGIRRDELVRHLESANIETREIFGGNILQQPGYRDVPHRVHGSLKNSDRVMRDSFFIGVYPALTEEMIQYVLKTFHAFFARGSRA